MYQANITPKQAGVATNTKKIQGIIKNYFESLFSSKLKNLKEMDKFLDTYGHP
jgi:hypothetical protein